MKNNLIRDRTAEGYADVAITLLIIIVFVVSLLAVLSVFTAQLQLNQTAQHVARVVELTGKADSATLNTALEGCFAPDDLKVESTWYNAADKTIQLKTRFTVRMTKRVAIVIMRPALGDPVAIYVDVGANAAGMSEVYYK